MYKSGIMIARVVKIYNCSSYHEIFTKIVEIFTIINEISTKI